MHWRVYANLPPPNGELCVVGRLRNGKTCTGIYTFYYFGDDSYWESSNGHRLKCDKKDHWCPVQSIIDSVSDRVIDEIEWECEKLRMRFGADIN